MSYPAALASVCTMNSHMGTTMKRMYPYIVACVLAAPAALHAQADPVSKLEGVLPPDVAAAVIATVTEAMQQGLPGRAVAELALQGVALGRSGPDVLNAARALVSELGASRAVLEREGRSRAAGGEVEAAALALRMGVDGAAVSELARTTPSGRSLAVPLLVTAALVERGLPSDDALSAVRSRLQARAGDAELVALPEAATLALTRGTTPADRGPAYGSGRVPGTLPLGGLGVPGGPPGGLPVNPGIPGTPGPPRGLPGRPLPPPVNPPIP